MIQKLSLLVIGLLSCLALSQTPSKGVYYEIFIRSFQDSTGDGIGDLQGVIRRLDYLEELGVDGIWLMPFHPSPSYHGYDVTDYYAIHPDYGTLEDFKELLQEAHARNIRIVMDLVVNHTSDRHPWFIQAKLNNPEYRDYYLWSNTDLGWRGVSGAPAWHRTETGYYLGLFWGGMPDLNFRNPEVVSTMNDIARYWLELGVDGFRIDAIQHIIESEEGNIRNTPETLEWVRDFNNFVRSVKPDAFVVGETWTDSETIVRYHTRAGLDMSFNYPLWRVLLEAIQSRSAANLAFFLQQDEAFYPADTYRATFISNHDQIRPATSLGVLRRDEARLKLAAALLLTLPGTPFLYYGEEIGLPNGPGERDEEKRTPMRWDDSDYAGFSTARPWYAFSTDDPSITVAAQRQDPDSILNWYRRLIALRRSHLALEQGLTEILASPQRSALLFKRHSADGSLLVVANLAANPVTLTLTDYGVVERTDLISGIRQPDALSVPGLGVMVFAMP